MPVSKIKDFEGCFDSLSKSKKSKQFVEMISAALDLCKNFKPDGWDAGVSEQPKQEVKKSKPNNKASKPKQKPQEVIVGTERQQMQILGASVESKLSEDDEEEEDEEEDIEDEKDKETKESTEEKKSSEQSKVSKTLNETSKKSKKKSATTQESKSEDEGSVAAHEEEEEVEELKPSKKSENKQKAKANSSKKSASEKKTKESKSKSKNATSKSAEKSKKDKGEGKKKGQAASTQDTEKSLVIPEADLVGLSSEEEGDDEMEEATISKERVQQLEQLDSDVAMKDSDNSKTKTDSSGSMREGQGRKDVDVGEADVNGEGEAGSKRIRDEVLDSANESASKSDIQAMDLKKRRLAQWSATATEEPKVEAPTPKPIDVERCRLFLGFVCFSVDGFP